MARRIIPFKSSATVFLRHPTNVVADPQEPLDNTNDGATSSFKIFDPKRDEVFSAAEAIGQTVWSVTNASVFKVSDVVEATQDGGTILTGTLTTVDPTAGTITSDTALAIAASAGNRVRVRLGGQVAMSEFGTPKLGKTDWGFQGALSSTHPGLKRDRDVDIEITFAGAGSGLDLLKIICAVIKEVEDCDEC